MLATDLIERLEEIVETLGDLPVQIDRLSPIEVADPVTADGDMAPLISDGPPAAMILIE